MKKLFPMLLALLLCSFAKGQESGIITGALTDKDNNNSPLPFANVIIKGTSKGTTTDFDGLYTIDNVPPGTYTIEFSFVGYEVKTINAIVIASGETITLNTGLAASAAVMDEVIVVADSNREKESALLLEQKKAIEIKQSIGAQELAKQAVSDAAAATAKISGVTKNEGSGDVFIRGLGDRYLQTTMNGLPIPSDDVEKKNINLELFPTSIIKNVSISKTYSCNFYADQASGNIDVVSKEHSGKAKLSIGISGGANTNVLQSRVWNNFSRTQNANNTSLGFYKTPPVGLKDALTQESWNAEKQNTPANFGVSISAGKKLWDKVSIFATGSHSNSYEERRGVFKAFRANVVNDTIFDAQRFSTKSTTTGLANIAYNVADGHKLKINSLFVNKLEDQVNEFGRNGRGAFFEETPIADGASQFVRDQNTKQTQISINQLFGDHELTKKDIVKWGVGYNYVNAGEPNRIRNEVNIYGENDIRFGNTGGFQQRKSFQRIKDIEYNGYLKYNRTIVESEATTVKANLGLHYRNKERKFDSRFEGLSLNRSSINFSVASIDNLTEGLNRESVVSGVFSIPRPQIALYDGLLEAIASNVSFDINIDKISANIGFRYEQDQLDLPIWDVPNQSTGEKSLFSNYTNVLPSFNIKYAVTDKMGIRFATSQTITLPEFKELAPFEYVSPNGRVTRGNPNLLPSTNFNYDLKWEFFPQSGELLSITTFYKRIENPINRTLTRGSAGVFSYFNTSNQADIFGLELEARLDLIKIEDKAKLSTNLNLTWMDHTQDLKSQDRGTAQFEEFRYKDNTSSGIQGAADWIINGSLTFSDEKENEFLATLSGNYSSDKIFALGSANEAQNFRTQYNDEILEKGFVTMNLVLSKVLNKKFKIRFSAKNLLNPEIKQTQLVRNPISGIETNETILSYKRGLDLSLGLNYTF